MTLVTEFSRLLVLEELEPDRFTARIPGDSGHHLFGGLTFGLAARAAALTVDLDRELYAATCQYIAGGTGGLDLEVEVDRVRDGRRLSLRRVRVHGGERLMFTCDAWFAPEGGDDDWQSDRPPDDFGQAAEMQATYGIPIDPFELRTVARPTEERFLDVHPYWARSRAGMGEDRSFQIGAIAFLSDLYTVGLLSIPGTADHPPLTDYTITLNHSLWVHRAVNLDHWTRVDGFPISVHGNRALAQGSIHDRAGALVASFAQEAMRRG